MRALVIFTPKNTHWAAGMLHPFFRHVHCVVDSSWVTAGWVAMDLTMENGLTLYPFETSEEELVSHYHDQGAEVFVADVDPEKRGRTTWITNNCVGMTKQALGIRSFALTPKQLFNHLMRNPSYEYRPNPAGTWGRRFEPTPSAA